MRNQVAERTESDKITNSVHMKWNLEIFRKRIKIERELKLRIPERTKMRFEVKPAA